jgi:hypothetical protein
MGEQSVSLFLLCRRYATPKSRSNAPWACRTKSLVFEKSFAADLGKARAKRKASFASQRLRLLTRHTGRARYRSGFPSKERSACIPD